MIRLTTVYRNAPGAHFDFDYYINNHLVMAKRLLTRYGMRSFQVLRCTEKLDGSEPEFLCVSIVEFDSFDGMKAGFAANKEELSADFSAYTNAQPEVHVCEIVYGT